MPRYSNPKLVLSTFILFWTALANSQTAAPQSAASAAAPASAAATPITIAAPPNDSANYLSDRVTFQFATFVKRIDMTTEGRTSLPGCAPAGTSFRGIGSAVVDGAGQSQALFVVKNVPTPEEEGKTSTGISRCANPSLRVKLGDVVLIAKDDMLATPPDRFGLTYGSLLVPFKYHVKGNKDFSGGASLGGYMGYRSDRSGQFGIAMQFVGFLGAANVAVPQNVNGQNITQNMTGVSYGLGLLGTVKDAFHMGLVLGADRVNASANYAENGKPWLAISLGFAFSN